MSDPKVLCLYRVRPFGGRPRYPKTPTALQKTLTQLQCRKVAIVVEVRNPRSLVWHPVGRFDPVAGYCSAHTPKESRHAPA